jgi:predicted nucleic acid-binding protein
MQNKIFIDSNIWLYLFLQDDNKKYRIAEEYLIKNNLSSSFIITYQVINEVANILLKNNFTEIEIRENIEYLLKVCTLQDFTKEILLTASFVREKYSISFWDSIIIGSALFAKCDILVSEDLQNGLIIDNKLLIKNIFYKETNIDKIDLL